MTARTSPTRAAPKALLLPELLTNIADHLEAPDISRCIRVCHAWNRQLVPSLWHTIDDRLYQWPTILFKHDSETPTGGRDKDWVYALFAKYGHHIRHLHTQWKIILNAASIGHNCMRLQGLYVYDMTSVRTSVEAAEDKRIWNLVPQLTGREAAMRAHPAAIGPILSPELEGVFEPAMVHLRSELQQVQDWITHQAFWLLVRRNPGLRVLRTDWSLSHLSQVKSLEFFYETMDLLPNLRDIDNQILCINLEHFLERLPHLQHYSAAVTFLENTPLSRTFDSLQTLRMPGHLPIRRFFNLLNYLPGLEHFQVGGFAGSEKDKDLDVAQILTNGPSRLKGLHFFDRHTDGEEQMPLQVLPWLPNLIEYTTVRLTLTAASALVRHCSKFEVFQQGYSGVTTHREARLVTDDNAVHILLLGCPNLKVIDAPHHRIHCDYVLGDEWVCRGLESLRCQFMGFSRLDDDELALYRKVYQGTDPDQAEALMQRNYPDLWKKFTNCRDQHTGVYKQLSRLHRLRTLDLGYEYRNIYLSTRTRHPIQQVDGQTYVDYGGPNLDSMELTWWSGLYLLETLVNLELFGFEGVDHLIDKQELEWMAAFWPKLKVMRGLQEDTLPRVRPDERKAKLRAYMSLLRPDVRHEGSGMSLTDMLPTPTQHAALGLPEVITRIGSFLPRKSIVACLQLNSSFHSILAPLIYRNVEIYSRNISKSPSPQALVRYAPLVHSLSINAYISLAYLTAGFKNLRSIFFSSFKRNQSHQVETDDEILGALLTLIQENPGLKTWMLDDPWPQIPGFIWKAIAEAAEATAGELDQLYLSHTTVNEESRPWFLRACRKAKKLQLFSVAVLGSGSGSGSRLSGDEIAGEQTDAHSSQLDSIQLSSIKPFSPRRVEFKSVLGISAREQLEFLSRCTNLQEVCWRSVTRDAHEKHTTDSQEPFPQLSDLQRLLQPTTWPSLISIDIDGDTDRSSGREPALRLSDECLGHILSSIPAGRLEQLVCMRSNIGTAGMRPLAHHFSSLSTLNARECARITSPMVQQLMESCPQLRRMDVKELHIRDLRHGRPWVCTRMTDLLVHFNLWLEQGDLGWRDFTCSLLTDKSQDAIETSRFIEDQLHVFERLAELTALESLDIQMIPPQFNGVASSDGSMMIHYGLLDFRVSRGGLEMLSTLRELQYLDLNGTFQRLERVDVERMVELWPKLEFLSGKLNPEEEIDSRLGEYLDEHDVDRGLLPGDREADDMAGLPSLDDTLSALVLENLVWSLGILTSVAVTSRPSSGRLYFKRIVETCH
ncbi:hypothetical protein BGX29_007709 [Mortierella sp. GBA35]|nr:hypothetical protein BGX29_007709 [Mortierella sp. GBA35]